MMKKRGLSIRILAFVLSVMMVLTLVPVNSLTVYADDDTCEHCGGTGVVCGEHQVKMDCEGDNEEHCKYGACVGKVRGQCTTTDHVYDYNYIDFRCSYCEGSGRKSGNHEHTYSSYVYDEVTSDPSRGSYCHKSVCDFDGCDNTDRWYCDNIGGICSVCGHNSSLTHAHSKGTYHEAKEASCIDGNIEYWECSCGKKIDSSLNEITDVTISATGIHDFVAIEGDSENHKCSVCGIQGNHNFSDQGDGTHKCADCGATETHEFVLEVKEGLVGQCKTKETCGVAGEYYKYCSNCDALSDETFEVSATGKHTFSEGVCADCGAENTSENHEITTWAQLKAAMESATEPTTIVLTQDIVATAEDKAIWPAATSIVLDLNGYTLDRNLSEPTAQGYVFAMINAGTDLTIKDSSPAKTGVITGAFSAIYSGYAGCILLQEGSLTLLGGTITGNKTLTYGGGIDKYPTAKLVVGGTARVIGNYAYEMGLTAQKSDIHFNDNVLDGFSFATGDDALVTEGEHKAQFGIRFWTGVDIAPVLWTLPSYEAGSCFVSNNQREQYMSEAKLVNGNWTLCLLLHDHEFDGEICTSKCELCGLIREDGIHNMTGDGCTRECSWCHIKFHSNDTYDSNGVCTQCKAHRVDDETLLDYQGVRYRLKINSDLSSVAEVYGYADDIKESIVIPKTIATSNGVYRVASFATGCFSGCTNIKHADIQAEVAGVNIAFVNCTRLESIKLPEGLTVISSREFDGCSNLTNVVIPNSVTEIGTYAFQGCSSLTTITIPDGVTKIGSWAYRDCINLTSLVIPNSVTEFNFNVFSGCSSLEYITIPNCVTVIGTGAFTDLSNLTSVVLPNSITKIGNQAFQGCSSLTTITIPDGVTTIGTQAFQGCGSLEIITIPNGVLEIGSRVFDGCNNLTTITIPDGVTEIGNYAFSSCSSLTSINLPENLTTIGNYAFSSCSSLTSINLPEGLTTIGSDAFDGCSSLTSVNLPENLATIGPYAFSRCSALKSIEIPGSVKTISEGAFQSTGLTSVIINQGVENIGKSAFIRCSSLTDVTIPSSVKTIGEFAFNSCTSLTDIVIPYGIESIYGGAFRYCTNLKSVTIPSSVTYVAPEEQPIFGGCSIGEFNVACTEYLNNVSPLQWSGVSKINRIHDYTAEEKKDDALKIAATCIDKAVYYRSCSTCGLVHKSDDDVFEGEALGHDWGEYILDGDQTCEEDGHKTAMCTREGCTVTNTIAATGAALGHDYTSETATAPYLKSKATCTADAVYFHKCSRCESKGATTWTKTGTALGHLFTEYSPDKCSICGFYADLIGAKLAGYSLSLHDNIGVDFYMELADSVMKDEGAKFIVKLEGDSLAEIPVSEARTTTVNGNTYYVFECRVAAAQMTSCISAKIVLGDGTEGTEYQFTVQDYAKYILEHEAEYEEVVPVVKAMLRYGASAQNYFGHNTDKMADVILSEADRTAALTTPELTTYNYSAPEATDTISFLGTSLLLESEVSLKCYFYTTVDLQYSNVIVKYGDKVLDTSDYQIGKNGNVQYVTVTGLTPADYGKQFTITVQDITVENVSAYGYMAQAFKQMGDSDKLTDLLKNMYAYGEAYKKCYILL